MDDIRAQDVADYFLATVDEDSGDNLSNLKLQKLVYYAQGFHLALTGEPLFPNRIMAWDHGPVVPGLYHKYKKYGSGAIPQPDDYDPSGCLPEVREILDAVNCVYGQYSPLKLAKLTHIEPPWQSTPRNGVIHLTLLQDFFLKVVEAGREGLAYQDEPVWPNFPFHHQRRREIMRKAPTRDTIRAALARSAGVPPTSDDD
jgi:uncharacterized phage-associated protein